jgi:hypothetical protein
MIKWSMMNAATEQCMCGGSCLRGQGCVLQEDPWQLLQAVHLRSCLHPASFSSQKLPACQVLQLPLLPPTSRAFSWAWKAAPLLLAPAVTWPTGSLQAWLLLLLLQADDPQAAAGQQLQASGSELFAAFRLPMHL